MEGIAAVFDKLYEQFLLKDVFGKVVPGLVLLIALGYSLSPESSFTFFDKLIAAEIDAFVATILLGASWIAGFVAQQLGVTTRLTSIETPENRQAYFGTMTKDDPGRARLRERAAVIKEAAGNGAIALFVLAVTFLLKEGRVNALLSLALILAGFLLLIRNGLSAARQQQLEWRIVKNATDEADKLPHTRSFALWLWKVTSGEKYPN